MLVPPLPEQAAICHYVFRATKSFLGVIELLQKQITMLLELRATIINDVVTGKVAVVTPENAERKVNAA